MKLTRYPKNPILKSNPKLTWQSSGIFNPCVISENGKFIMLFRATGKAKPIKGVGNWKEWRTSSIGYAEGQDGIHFKIRPTPLIKSEHPWEKLGCEDARVTKIGDTYYIFYSAISWGKNFLKCRIALAETKDFRKIKKYGIIGPNFPNDPDYLKAAAFFPEKIQNKFCLLFTKQALTKISKDNLDHHGFPESTIFVAKFSNLRDLVNPPKNFWQKFLAEKKKHILLKPSKSACRGPEVGAPPIKTKKGWLLIYCGESKKREWTIDGALLDLKNPQKILWRSKDHLLSPEKSYEKNGIISRVTFPEGAVIIGRRLLVYYGSADQGCCLATTNLE